MELLQGQITLGQLWQNPQARGFLIQQIPYLKRGLPGRFQTMTLRQAMIAASRFLSKERIQYIYDYLSQL